VGCDGVVGVHSGETACSSSRVHVSQLISLHFQAPSNEEEVRYLMSSWLTGASTVRSSMFWSHGHFVKVTYLQ
jgi:hypothetical protein